jgi:hypothetical protein
MVCLGSVEPGRDGAGGMKRFLWTTAKRQTTLCQALSASGAGATVRVGGVELAEKADP